MSRPIDPPTGPRTDATTEEAADPGAAHAVRALLAAAAEDGPPTTDLLGKVRHRVRRRRALVPSLAALSAVGVLAAVAVATSTVTVAPPASAQERVAAAVTRTAREGYRIRAVTSGTKAGDNGTTVAEGVYDPALRAVRMVVVTPDEGHVTIHLDDAVYVQIPEEFVGRQPGVPEGARWIVRPRGYPRDIGISELAEFGGRALLSPQQALDWVRSAGDVREDGPASGDGWTGTRFTFTMTDRFWRVTGSVDVDGDGQVRRLAFTTTSTDTAHGVAGSHSAELTLSDFGIHERVTLPPESQVYRMPDPRRLADELKERRRQGK